MLRLQWTWIWGRHHPIHYSLLCNKNRLLPWEEWDTSKSVVHRDGGALVHRYSWRPPALAMGKVPNLRSGRNPLVRCSLKPLAPASWKSFLDCNVSWPIWSGFREVGLPQDSTAFTTSLIPTCTSSGAECNFKLQPSKAFTGTGSWVFLAIQFLKKQPLDLFASNPFLMLVTTPKILSYT